jgi:hypothetical protein
MTIDEQHYLTRITTLEAEVKRLKSFPVIEFHQWDWIEGFAAFVDDGQKFNPESKAFCVLNLGSLLAAIEMKDMPQSKLAYHLADCMTHEVTHVIEKWCGVEFSEEKVEVVRERYRNAAQGMAAEMNGPPEKR